MPIRLTHFLALLIFWIFPRQSTGQVDSLFKIDHRLHYDAVRTLYSDLLRRYPENVAEKLAEMETQSRRAGQEMLARHFWSMQYQHRINLLPENDSQRVDVAREALEICEKKRWNVMTAEWLLRLGDIHYALNDYGPAFEHLLHGHKLSKVLGYTQYPHLAERLIMLGLGHYYFGDYSAALEYFKELLETGDSYIDHRVYLNALNTSGLCFQQLAQPDSSLHYFTKAHDYALEKLKDTSYAILINGNKAVVLRQLGRTDEAIPLLEQDFRQSPRYNHLGSAANAAVELASIYLERNDLRRSELYLEYVHRHSKEVSPKYLKEHYTNISRLYKLRGDLSRAFVYLDSAVMLDHRLTQDKDEKILVQAKQRAQVEQHLREIERIEQNGKRREIFRNVTIFVLLVTGASVILLYRKRLIAARLKKQLAEEQLTHAREALHAYTQTLIEKNNIIDAFKQKMEQEKGKPDTADLNSLLSHAILTQDDWQEFRKLFEKVYPGYFYRIKKQYPDITQADMRLLSLVKLRLSPKDMAMVLGISDDSIKKSRHRLRQRIRLPEDIDLKDFADSI